MTQIKVERRPDDKRLQELGIRKWPVWTKETSEFPWAYESQEVCYFLEGEVTVTPEGGEPVTMGKGDLVTFPASPAPGRSPETCASTTVLIDKAGKAGTEACASKPFLGHKPELIEIKAFVDIRQDFLVVD